MNIFKIFIILTVFTLLAGCSRLPPGTPYYSQTAYSVNKLNLAAAIGPFMLNEFYKDYAGIHEDIFIPVEGNYNTGFIIQKCNDNLRIYYLNETGSLSNAINLNNSNYLAKTIPKSIPTLFILGSASDGIDYKIIQFSTTMNQLTTLSITDKLNSTIFDNLGASYPGMINNSLSVKSAYISPIDNRIYFLFFCNYNTYEGYYECNYQLTSTGITDPKTTRGNTRVVLSSVQSLFNYFYDSLNTTSFISFPGFSKENYSWNNNLNPTLITGLPDNVAYLLSNSFIALVAGNAMSIYNNIGAIQNTVVLGGNKFLYEVKDESGNYQMLFSYCQILNEYENEQFYFYIYSLPTSAFVNL